MRLTYIAFTFAFVQPLLHLRYEGSGFDFEHV